MPRPDTALVTKTPPCSHPSPLVPKRVSLPAAAGASRVDVQRARSHDGYVQPLSHSPLVKLRAALNKPIIRHRPHERRRNPAHVFRFHKDAPDAAIESGPS
jgi:hypothetical protein